MIPRVEFESRIFLYFSQIRPASHSSEHNISGLVMAENLTTVHFKSDATRFTKVWNAFQLLYVETLAIKIYLSLPLNSGMNSNRVLILCLANLRITQ